MNAARFSIRLIRKWSPRLRESRFPCEIVEIDATGTRIHSETTFINLDHFRFRALAHLVATISETIRQYRWSINPSRVPARARRSRHKHDNEEFLEVSITLHRIDGDGKCERANRPHSKLDPPRVSSAEVRSKGKPKMRNVKLARGWTKTIARTDTEN